MANLRRLTACCALLLLLGGCTRHFFHKSADKEVDDILREKDRYKDWHLEQYHVDPDPRARFADDGNPDRPPMPPDDPAAHDLSPNPQKPPKKAGIRLMEGEQYIDIMTEWDALNRATKKVEKKEDKKSDTPSYADAASPYRDPLVSQKPSRSFLLKLDQALELALFNSREFQDRREDLYLVSLPVTTERFAFGPQFFAASQLMRERLGKLFPGGPADRWVSNSTLGVSKLFSTGALLMFQFANRTVVEMANPRVPRVISESRIDFDAIQPLLRGGGKAVTLEALTLSERNLLYEIRDFARFRKQFYVAIAAGADIGGTTVGATRLRVRPTAFNFTDFVPGAQLQPRNGGLPGINASGFANASGYLPVVLNQTLLENDRNNVAKLEQFLRLFQGFQEADQIAQLQVDRVEQQLLQGRSSAYVRDQNYRDSLDRFKLQLGIPTDMPLELDDEPVSPQRNQLRAFEKIIEDYESVRAEASDLDKLADPTRLRREFVRLATASRLVQGTEFRTRFLRRWSEWQQKAPPRLDLETPALRRQLARLNELLSAQFRKRDEFEKDNKPVPPAVLNRIRELTFETDVLRLELSLRAAEEVVALGEALRVVRAAAVVGGLSSSPPLAWVPLLSFTGQEIRQQYLSRFNEAFDDFERGVLIEARNERVEKVRKEWPALPRVCVEGVDLMTADLEHAEAVVARTAIGHRFDLMNVRAQLVDSWRQIAVAANSLLGTFNIEYHLTSLTPPGLDRPFAFDGSRSRHRLVFNGELPLVRIVERNIYRASLIGWQRQRRTLMGTEDTIVSNVRSEVRQLRVLAENYRISQRAVELAYLQVENSLDVFRTPPLPTAQTTDSSALTQQLLEAQRNLITAQNQLVTFWVQYLTTRMQLYRDLEIMPLDPRGAWIDDISTCHCPDGSPSPVGVDAPQRPAGQEEDAPPPRQVEPHDPPAARPGGGDRVDQRSRGFLPALFGAGAR